MRRPSIEGLLADFGDDRRATVLAQGVTDALVGLFDRNSSGPFGLAEPAAEDALDLELIKEEAREEGRNEARAQADAELEERLAEARAAFDEELRAAREAWALQAGQAIADQINEQFEACVDDLSSVAVRVLSPFLTEQVRLRAAHDLALQIKALVAEDQGLRLLVRGPGDLLDVIRSSVGTSIANISWDEAPESEVRVVAGATIIETQMTLWLASLEETAS